MTTVLFRFKFVCNPHTTQIGIAKRRISMMMFKPVIVFHSATYQNKPSCQLRK